MYIWFLTIYNWASRESGNRWHTHLSLLYWLLWKTSFGDDLTLSHLQPCLYNHSREPRLLTLGERTRYHSRWQRDWALMWVMDWKQRGRWKGITITFDKNLKTANGRADEQTLLAVRGIKKHVCKWQSYRRGDRAFGSDHSIIWCPKVFHLRESFVSPSTSAWTSRSSPVIHSNVHTALPAFSRQQGLTLSPDPQWSSLAYPSTLGPQNHPCLSLLCAEWQ